MNSANENSQSAPKKKSLESIRQIVEEYFGKPFEEISAEELKNAGDEEIDWGPDVGEEIIPW